MRTKTDFYLIKGNLIVQNNGVYIFIKLHRFGSVRVGSVSVLNGSARYRFMPTFPNHLIGGNSDIITSNNKYLQVAALYAINRFGSVRFGSVSVHEIRIRLNAKIGGSR
jgi:hypothetical protein